MLQALMGMGGILTLFILFFIYRTYVTGSYELLSWRNFFLLGYVQFYCLAIVLAAPYGFGSPIYQPTGEAFPKLLIAVPLFLGLFLITQYFAHRWTWVDVYAPKYAFPVTNSGVLLITLALAAVVVGTIPLGGGSVGEAILFFVRMSVASCAAGLAFYLLLSSPRNPVWWGLFVPLFALAVLVSITNTIGRRDFLSVFFIVPWVWYYAKLRYEKRSKVLLRLGIAAGVIAFSLIVYNAGRSALGFTDSTLGARASQLVDLVKSPDLSRRNVEGELLRQDTPLNTIAIMENYPDPYAYMPLHGLQLYITNPIPRRFYDDKPSALGIILMTQFNTFGANLGPGILGHGWAEASWIGIIYYALTFGVITGAVDRLTRMRAANPYWICAIGAALGNILALPRGETSIFFMLVSAGFLVISVVMYVVATFMKPYMMAGQPIHMFPEGAAAVELDEFGEPIYADEPFHDDPAYGEQAYADEQARSS